MSAVQLRSGAPVELDPQSKTYAASLAVMRRAEERAAERLRSRGWIVLPPGTRVHPGGLVDVPLPLDMEDDEL